MSSLPLFLDGKNVPPSNRHLLFGWNCGRLTFEVRVWLLRNEAENRRKRVLQTQWWEQFSSSSRCFDLQLQSLVDCVFVQILRHLQTHGFFNATSWANFLSLGVTCLFVRKEEVWPFTKSDWNLFLMPSILQTEVQWSPSGVSCFDVNTSSVYLNKELGLEGLNIFCQIKTLHWLDKYQVHLLKSFWVGSTRVYRK